MRSLKEIACLFKLRSWQALISDDSTLEAMEQVAIDMNDDAVETDLSIPAAPALPASPEGHACMHM